MSILFTAFKGNYNTSFILVDRIGRESLFLTNSFSGSEKEIACFEKEYDTVCMFGVDKNLVNKIRIETCAQNEEKIICSAFDISSLASKMSDLNIEYVISDVPAHYLCNSAYYRMLCKNKNTVFIHIPSQKGMNDELMSKLTELYRSLQNPC